MRKRLAFGVLPALSVLLAGCGGAGSGLTVPQVAPAKVFSLAGFQPAGSITPGTPVTVSSPDAPNCGALAGVASSRISGTSTAPGKLTIGVLLYEPGTWRLFLQMKLAGRIVTAPYTLEVAS